MEEAEFVSKNTQSMCVSLTQNDKHHFSGACDRYLVKAKICRNSSPEGMGGGRIRTLILLGIKESGGKSEVAELLNYDKGWNIFSGDSQILLAYTFVRQVLEEIPQDKLADES
jgi:hypothetical protein